jgi:hypothetical protein
MRALTGLVGAVDALHDELSCRALITGCYRLIGGRRRRKQRAIGWA